MIARGGGFQQHGGPGAVFRIIPRKVPSLDDLNLPPAVARLAQQAKSHCVLSTLRDLQAHIAATDPGLIDKVWILEDCMSSVPPPPINPLPPSLDFPRIADAAFEELKPTWAPYFPTKEDVFVEVGTLILERIGASLHAADLPADASAAHLLERAVLPGIDWHEAHPALSKVSVAVMMRQPSSLSARDPSITVLEDILVGIVEAGKAAGQFRADADARTAADVLLAVYFMGIVDWHQKGAKRGALKAQARAALDLVIKGIAA